MVSTTEADVLSLVLMSGVFFACSDQFENDLSGPSVGADGSPEDPQQCWDLNDNGEADFDEDTNGDGVVDVYDCRGADGDAGQDCWDLDGDGVADPDEDVNGDGVIDVEDCRGADGDDAGPGDTGEPEPEPDDRVFLGDLRVEDPDVAAYFCENYDRVYGDLLIQEWEPDTLDAFACLIEVTGDLTVQMGHERKLRELSLPNLERVGGELSVPNFEEATLVSFPLLVSAGRLWLDSTRYCILEELRFPVLERVEDTFAIYDVPCIDTLEAPALTTVGSFLIQNVDDVDVLDGFPSLATIDERFTLYYNQDVRDVSGFTSLAYVGEDFQVAYNPSLATSDAQALADGIAFIGGVVHIHGNSGR